MKLQPPPLDNDISDGYELSFIWRNFFSQLKKWSDFVPTTPLSGDDDTALDARVTALEAQVTINVSAISALQGRVSVLENKAYGGMRKTSVQTIGTLGTTWVNIVNYTATTFDANNNVNVNLTTGTISPTVAGQYNVIVNFEFTCTVNNNNSEQFNIQLYNVTDAVMMPTTTMSVWQGANQNGAAISAIAPFTITAANINKLYIMRVSSPTNVSNFVVTQASLSMEEL
jgi:hypothetical protein